MVSTILQALAAIDAVRRLRWMVNSPVALLIAKLTSDVLRHRFAKSGTRTLALFPMA
jgi:hypothetical protein